MKQLLISGDVNKSNARYDKKIHNPPVSSINKKLTEFQETSSSRTLTNNTAERMLFELQLEKIKPGSNLGTNTRHPTQVRHSIKNRRTTQYCKNPIIIENYHQKLFSKNFCSILKTILKNYSQNIKVYYNKTGSYQQRYH